MSELGKAALLFYAFDGSLIWPGNVGAGGGAPGVCINRDTWGGGCAPAHLILVISESPSGFMGSSRRY